MFVMHFSGTFAKVVFIWFSHKNTPKSTIKYKSLILAYVCTNSGLFEEDMFISYVLIWHYQTWHIDLA